MIWHAINCSNVIILEQIKRYDFSLIGSYLVHQIILFFLPNFLNKYSRTFYVRWSAYWVHAFFEWCVRQKMWHILITFWVQWRAKRCPLARKAFGLSYYTSVFIHVNMAFTIRPFVKAFPVIDNIITPSNPADSGSHIGLGFRTKFLGESRTNLFLNE